MNEGLSKKRHLKVGILGAGQLALMLAESVLKKGCEVQVYAQSLEEPACSIAHNVLLGAVDDAKKLKNFFEISDIILLESEFFQPDLLLELEGLTKASVFPSPCAYKKLYSKENQKDFFRRIGIPSVRFAKVKKKEDIEEINFSAPYMVKLSSGGYDGYGNFEIKTLEELKNKVDELSNNYQKTLIIEQKIIIKNEYASMLIKNEKNSIIFPPCQTVQEDSICKMVIFPSGLNSDKSQELLNYMKIIDENLKGVGVFAFEFFEDQNGSILVNEAAPRVHNSYHYTMEAYNKSQFDLFFDAVLGHELKIPKLQHKYLSMVNLLGQSTGTDYQLNFPHFEGDFEFKIHMYRKKQSFLGRKLGHITLYGPEENFQFAQKINEEYRL